jgi:hypothetical protein
VSNGTEIRSAVLELFRLTRLCNANTRICADRKIVAHAPKILNQAVKWAYEFSVRLFRCPNVNVSQFWTLIALNMTDPSM